MRQINRQQDAAVVDIFEQGDSRYAQLKNAIIMMIDDEPIMLEILQVLLEDAGYKHVIPVDRSIQAVDRIIQTDPDILLLDLDMPEVDGYEVLQAVRAHEQFSFLPVIILTASSDPKSRLRALELGATDFLSKPVDQSELVLRVRNTLSAKAYQDQLTYYDSLTGLPNRKLFIDRLGWGIELANRENRPMALLDIGLDRFRQINETLGMYVGDRILKTVADRILSVVQNSHGFGRNDNMRRTVNMARTGGDEFSIILCGVSSMENAAALSKHVLDAVRQPFFVDDNEIFLSANIGIAAYPEDGETVESLIKHASSAKDFARKQGADNCQFYSSEMNQRSIERMKMESSLWKALEKHEFELNYQPKIDIVSGAVSGMECLLRWFHPERGSVSPVEFIPIAEDLGLIVPIGTWVLQEACRQTRELHDAGYGDLSVSVNVSARQFHDAGLRAAIISALNTSGLDPRKLVLELTESTLMGDVEHYVDLLNELKDLGVAFSIDDFGTGYSSLTYLKRFPINELKIDRSFLIGVPTNNEDNSIVRAIIALAHSLGHKVVAEGVEHTQQLEFLRQHGCDIIQGFYYSKPLNKADFLDYLSSKR
jgi:diguanylate cyclase (GGDEF)-like protein